MPTFTFTVDYSTEAERLALEQTAAYLADLRRVALDAPAGMWQNVASGNAASPACK